MFWKKWPYWIKGGIIGLFVAIIFSIILQFFGFAPIIWHLHQNLVKDLVYPLKYSLPDFVYNYILKPLVYIVYGIIIGIIVDVIKKKKK